MRIPAFSRALAFVAGALAIGAATGCSSVKVVSDWDREVDFSEYTTYRWAPTQESASTSQGTHHTLIDKRIRAAVDRAMSQKGYALKRRGHPDLLMVYQARLQEKIDVYRHYPRGWSGYVDVDSYRQGTLALMIVDPDLDQVVWQGWVVGLVDRPEDSAENINNAVSKILERFPPS